MFWERDGQGQDRKDNLNTLGVGSRPACFQASARSLLTNKESREGKSSRIARRKPPQRPRPW